MENNEETPSNIIDLRNITKMMIDPTYTIYHDDEEILSSSQVSEDPIYKEISGGREQITYNTNQMTPNKLYNVELDGEKLSIMVDERKKLHVWIKDD